MTPTTTIPILEGDGIGPEIWAASRLVFDAALQRHLPNQRVEWRTVPAGQRAFDTTGDYLPTVTLDAIRQHKVALKGPLTTPVGEGFRSINVTLRKTFDLYACVRPVTWFDGVPSPVRHPERVDMVIFRENTEDIYAGIEWAYDSTEAQTIRDTITTLNGSLNVPFPSTTGFGIKPISKDGSKRLMRAAIDFAIARSRRSVTIVHKGNIMKFTEGAFRNWCYEVAIEEYSDRVFTWKTYEQISRLEGATAARSALDAATADGKIIIKDHICDAFFQDSLLCPENFDVVATTNLNGDYISDALAAQVGGIGLSPGANINTATGYGIFEATHGTAPSIAGRNIANPSAMILSGALLFDHLGWHHASTAITSALSDTLRARESTVDINPDNPIGTTEFAQALVRRITAA